MGTASAEKICRGESTALVSAGATATRWYQIVQKGKTSLRKLIGEGAGLKVAPSKTTTYEAELINPKGACCNGTISKKCLQTVTVVVVEPPFAAAGSNQTTVFGQSVHIGTMLPQKGRTYAWSPAAGLSAPNSAQTKAQPKTTTTYTLTVTDSAMGCTAEDEVTVFVKQKIKPPLPPEIEVTVSPNPVSDHATVALLSEGEIRSIRVFSTTGNLIHEQTDLAQTAVELNTGKWELGLHKIQVGVRLPDGSVRYWSGKVVKL